MKTEFQNAIIRKLKLLREERGLSQAAIAKILGISSGQIGNIESYKHPHKYTIKQISILCENLHLNIAELFLPNITVIDVTLINRLIDQIIKYQENDTKNY